MYSSLAEESLVQKYVKITAAVAIYWYGVTLMNIKENYVKPQLLQVHIHHYCVRQQSPSKQRHNKLGRSALCHLVPVRIHRLRLLRLLAPGPTVSAAHQLSGRQSLQMAHHNGSRTVGRSLYAYHWHE